MNNKKVEIKDVLFWDKVFDVLTDVGGAIEHDRQNFIRQKGNFREWRFGGKFGFGGKIWNTDTGLRVNYYSEDKTEKLDRLREDINIELDELVETYEKYGMDV